MRGDRLATLLRLRKMARDAARQELTAAEEACHQAGRIRDAAEAEIQRELQSASAVDRDDQAVETFAAWLVAARRHLAGCTQACDAADARLTEARATFTLARQAVETIETAIAEHDQAMRSAELRQEQKRLDEIPKSRRLRPI